MAASLAEQFAAWLANLAHYNIAITLAMVLGLSALLLLALVLRLFRALLPLLVLAGAVALCWYTGMLD